MKGAPAHRKASIAAALRSVLAFVVLAALAGRAESARQPATSGSAAPSSASSGALTEAEVRTLIQKDLYSGEKIGTLSVIPESEEARIAARWTVYLIDDGKRFHPLFHPPTVILYETLPGKAHFPARGSSPDSNPASAPEFQGWQQKLAFTRYLMRQVVVLRCMLYCRHQMDALDQENLHDAEQELAALTGQPQQQ